MSKIEVDAIEPQSGTTLTVGASGDTITVPSGATFDASNATTTLPSTIVTTTGTQTLSNKTIDASQLSGTVSIDRLGSSGTKDSTTFLRGDNTFAAAGGGKVLQMVYGNYATQTSTTSTGFVDLNASTNVSITPSATSSKILVIAHFHNIYMDAANGYASPYIQITAGGTDIIQSQSLFTALLTGEEQTNQELIIVHSPNTTSSVEYKMRFRTSSGSYPAYLNYGSVNGGSSLILMEIGA